MASPNATRAADTLADWRISPILGITATLLACGGAMVPAVPAPNAAAGALVREAEQIVPPVAIACRLQSTAWSQRTMHLRQKPGVDAYATVNKPGAVRASFAMGRHEAFAEVDTGGVTVRGYLDAEDIEIYAKGPTTLKDAFVVLPGVPLTWRAARNNQLDFDLPVETRYVRSADGKPTVEYGCEYFSIDRTQFTPVEKTGNALGKAAIRPGFNTLHKDAALTVPVATITADDKAPYATVLALQGDSARIAWSVGQAYVFGWLPLKAIVRKPETLQTGEWKRTDAELNLKKRDTELPTYKRCKTAAEFSLYMRMKGVLVNIGSVGSGAAIQLGPRDGVMVRATFPDSDLLPNDNASFFVAAEVLDGCN
jgi:hypothetical protein